ncbi:aminotransferase class V-fold PLP-dependent enzyme [Psychrosphaera aestuarii]|uniref:aminotransferase class V-fold PLP-dependent enzyme n=1 Tax=Psychrosphaera aestuarii TaxID=1266052 RepID=UPI001B3320B0|nr:aminotransferase class V-fold PLP-dependent enzyme [Psychrosphaera aestuarii]
MKSIVGRYGLFPFLERFSATSCWSDAQQTLRHRQAEHQTMIEQVNQNNVTIKPVPWCFEAGTPAMESVIGLGAAARFLLDIGMENVHQHVHGLTIQLRQALNELYPEMLLETRMLLDLSP